MVGSSAFVLLERGPKADSAAVLSVLKSLTYPTRTSGLAPAATRYVSINSILILWIALSICPATSGPKLILTLQPDLSVLLQQSQNYIRKEHLPQLSKAL